MPAIATGKYHNGYPPSAGIANAWAAQNLYLWGLAANTRDVFAGALARGNNDSGAEAIGSWSFRYAGNTTLLCDIVVSGALALVLNIPNEGVATHIVLGNGSYTTLDISGGGASYTVGKEYVVTATIFGPSGASAGIYLLAAQVANAVNWPTLATFNDVTTPTETDYAAITTAQSNLLNIAQAPTGQGVRVTHINNTGNFDQFVAGSIYYRGQNTITITYFVQNGGAAVLTVNGDAGWTDTFNLTIDAKEHTGTFTLSAAHYTANTFYRFTVGSTSTQTNYVDCISIGGVKALTSPPAYFASLSPYRGSTGSPGARLKPIGGNGATDNLTEIAVALRGSPSIGSARLGFQFMSPLVASSGSIYQTFQLGPSFRRPHILQYLAWLPTASGQGGTVTLAQAASGEAGPLSVGYSFGLTDTNNGGWNVTEMDSQPGLAYGQFYVVTGVSSCFEVATP